MYRIVSEGKSISLCDEPRYVRRKPSTGAWIRTDEENAEAVSVRGMLYSIPGKPVIEGAPVVSIMQIDGGEVLHIASVEQDKLTSETVPDLEDAVAELGEFADEAATETGDAVIDLADYVAELEERIAALEER